MTRKPRLVIRFYVEKIWLQKAVKDVVCDDDGTDPTLDISSLLFDQLSGTSYKKCLISGLFLLVFNTIYKITNYWIRTADL